MNILLSARLLPDVEVTKQGDGETMSGFQPPVLPSNGSLGRLCDPHGCRGPRRSQRCSMRKQLIERREIPVFKEVHTSLRALARSDHGHGDTVPMGTAGRHARTVPSRSGRHIT